MCRGQQKHIYSSMEIEKLWQVRKYVLYINVFLTEMFQVPGKWSFLLLIPTHMIHTVKSIEWLGMKMSGFVCWDFFLYVLSRMSLRPSWGLDCELSVSTKFTSNGSAICNIELKSCRCSMILYRTSLWFWRKKSTILKNIHFRTTDKEL